MYKIHSSNVHATQSDDNLQCGRQGFFTFEGEDKGTVGDSGLTLKGGLVGDLHDVTRPDIIQNELFLTFCFLHLLLLDHVFYELLWTHVSVQGRDLIGQDYVRVCPFSQARLPMLGEGSYSWDPLWIVAGFIKD